MSSFQPPVPPVPCKVFISYSHRDEALREELDVHLASLKRQQKIEAWHDRAIEAGTEWDAQIKHSLETASIILLLISPRFMASDYCYDLEMQSALERHNAGTARVIPIILKPVDWQSSPFSRLQVLPKDAFPITRWSDRDEAFLNVVQGIRRAVESLQTAPPQNDSEVTPLPTGEQSSPPISSEKRSGRKVNLESPEGQTRIDSNLYLVSPYEERCTAEIQKPGSLIRIKSPQNMGKSSLMARVLESGRQLGYRTVEIELAQTNQKFFRDMDLFMQWFCASVGKPLGIRVKTDDYWDDIFGANDNSTDYFEQYILNEDDPPLVLAIDNFDRVFRYPDIETDLCGLLRGWHDRSRTTKQWEQLRLIIVHSQESYAVKDINQSPFNIGLPIELGEFTPAQVAELVQRHGLIWTDADVGQLMGLIGGHPYMVRLALYYIAAGDFDLDEFLQTAPTEAGVYSALLRRHLQTLAERPELGAAMQTVVDAEGPVSLRSDVSFQLDSMGLVVRVDNDVMPRCALYRQYFRERLRDVS